MRCFGIGLLSCLAIYAGYLVSSQYSVGSATGSSSFGSSLVSYQEVAREDYLRLPVFTSTRGHPAPTPQSEGAGKATIKGLYPGHDIIDTQGVQQGSGEGTEESGRGVTAIITEAAEEHGVPVGLMLALAREENRQLDPEAIYETPRERSIGIYQMNVKGGMGIGHAEEALMDPEYNADLAAQTIRREYERTGTWRGALWPWRGTRDAALAKWREE